MSDDLPVWADPYLAECRDLFGLADWTITLEQNDMPGKRDSTDGFVELEARYLTATITIRRGLTEARGRHTIMHEALHVALAHLARAAQNMIEQLLPDDTQAYATRQYQDAEEQTIERLTRALQKATTTRPQGRAEQD